MVHEQDITVICAEQDVAEPESSHPQSRLCIEILEEISFLYTPFMFDLLIVKPTP